MNDARIKVGAVAPMIISAGKATDITANVVYADALCPTISDNTAYDKTVVFAAAHIPA